MSDVIANTEFKRAIPTEVFHHLPPHSRVLHIGGHLGKEAEYYNDVVFVEPIPKYATYLRDQGFMVIEGAIGGDELFVTTFEQASSVLKPKDHIVAEVIKVKNYSLDDINDGSFDLLVLDVQGSELAVLKSGKLTFQHIIVEASVRPRYDSAPTKMDIEQYMESKQYQKISEYQHGKFDIYDMVFRLC